MVECKDFETADLDLVLAALADPTRRSIMRALSSGEQCVTEIAAPFEMSLNAVSKHIKALEGAGLVTRRRLGRQHFLVANPDPIKNAAAWFDAQRRFWTARLDTLESLIREEIADE